MHLSYADVYDPRCMESITASYVRLLTSKVYADMILLHLFQFSSREILNSLISNDPTAVWWSFSSSDGESASHHQPCCLLRFQTRKFCYSKDYRSPHALPLWETHPLLCHVTPTLILLSVCADASLVWHITVKTRGGGNECIRCFELLSAALNLLMMSLLMAVLLLVAGSTWDK